MSMLFQLATMPPSVIEVSPKAMWGWSLLSIWIEVPVIDSDIPVQ